MTMNFKDKHLFIFDVDGTLTISKTPMDPSMAGVFLKLLDKHKAAAISGTGLEMFKKDLIEPLTAAAKGKGNFENFFLFPTCGAAFYRFKNGSWQLIYEHVLTDDEKKKIFDAFERVFHALNYKHPKKIYGSAPIQDRRTQVAFSPLGQSAPVGEKEAWAKANNPLRLKMRELLEAQLREFDVRVGGMTTIDISRKGIDKGYGIKQMELHLGIRKEDMLYFGDLLMPGGNDYPVKQLGVECIAVTSPEDTKKIIEGIL